MASGDGATMTTCPGCGAENAEGARYCTQCGTQISHDASAPRQGAESGGPQPGAEEDDRWRGQTLGGRYCLRRKIGRGAMGTVFEAEHVRLQKRVAIKMLH